MININQQIDSYDVVPLKDESKWCNRDGGEGVAVDDEHVVAHAVVEGHLGDDVHAGVAELQGGHGDVRLGLLEEITVAAHGDGGILV